MTLKNSKSKPAKAVAKVRSISKKEIVKIPLGESSWEIVNHKLKFISDCQSKVNEGQASLNELVTAMIEQSGNKIGKYRFNFDERTIELINE